MPDNLAELRALHAAGVFGFKGFLSPSGVDEFPHLTRSQLAAVLAELTAVDGLLLVHAQDPRHLASAPPASGPRYADFLASRPRSVEGEAIATLIEAARASGGRVHLLHLSSGEALPMIAAARAAGLRISVETCPHFLTLAVEEVPDGATEFKCCPPIREAANQDLLWQGLRESVIDCVVSDHSPSTPELKTGDFGTAWGGISSLQLGLPAPSGAPPGHAATTWRTSPAGCRRLLPRLPGSPPRAPSRRAGTPTSRSSRRSGHSPWTRPDCTTATGSRRTRAGRCAASCGPPGCAASGSPGTVSRPRPPAAGCSPAADRSRRPAGRSPRRRARRSHRARLAGGYFAPRWKRRRKRKAAKMCTPTR